MKEHSRSAQNRSYISAIDGLRAIAVLAVIANHFENSILPSGYLGVDVFFVISGFVITLSLAGSTVAPLSSAMVTFYARRFRRLAPALVLVVMCGCGLIRLFDPDPIKSIQTGMFSLVGAANLYLYALSLDYFGPTTQLNPFTHMWSLGVEEQFYLIFPTIMLFRPLGPYRGSLIAALSAASLAGFAAMYNGAQAAAYFLIPFRFWELGAGALLALFAAAGRLGVRDGLPGGAILTPLLALCAIFLLPGTAPVLTTIAAVALSCGVIAVIWRARVPGNLLAAPISLYFGKLSYSLYLWHWIVICISRWTIGISTVTFPWQILIILALSHLTYTCVEMPLRRQLWFGSHRATVLAGLGLVGVAIVGIYVTNGRGYPAFSGSIKAARDADPGIVPGYRGLYSQRLVDDCAVDVVFARETNGLAGRLARCRVVTSPAKVDLLFIGDSHSLDLFPVGDLLARDGVANVTNLYENSCPLPPTSNADTKCGLSVRFIQKLPRVAPYSSVIIIRNNIAPKRLDGRLSSYSVALEALVSSLAARGYQVVYAAPSPKYDSIGPGALCSVQWFRPKSALAARCAEGFTELRSEQEARRADFLAVLKELEVRQTAFHLFDPFAVLCGVDTVYCSPMRNGHVLYRDKSHLTEHGSVLLYAPLRKYLVDEGLLRGAAKVIQSGSQGVTPEMPNNTLLVGKR